MKKYLEIYTYYKDLIDAQQMQKGDKLPSVRKATELFSVSKTTIQNAYFDLQADGYIIAVEKSGYFVTDYVASNKKAPIIKTDKKKIDFDLKSGNADKASFDLKLWQRYIKTALRENERMLEYGDVQGEYDLRLALSDYIREKRNVSASAERIVVGAGVQALLGILCSLLNKDKTVSFPDKSFIQGMGLFNDYGFNVTTRNKDADIIYVCPSHMTSYGDVMPIKRRLELVEYSKMNKSLVIEDDYDSDFLYNTKPMPALFALSNGSNVVYMGSFSNVLIPGIRISFMVLTKELSDEFEKNKTKYAQTASKTEQIALCKYIRDGHIKSQTRKIRRLYTSKTKLFYNELKKQIPNAEFKISENKIQIRMKAKYNKNAKEFESNGLSVYIESIDNGEIKLILSPSSIDINDISNCVLRLKKVLK